jgi:EF-P lysine aminoacylase GenX
MQNWERAKKDNSLKEIQIKRTKINNLIRNFFNAKGFLEAQTPILVKCAGQEPYLSPFKTSFGDEKNKKYKGFLITSPEYSLKKMLAGGFDKIYEMARVFRANESLGGTHNPEFTMLEWYRANSDYKKIMEDTENLILFLNKKINRSNILNYQGQKINLTTPWQRISVKELFSKYANIDLDKTKTLKNFRNQAKKSKINVNSKDNDWNSIFYDIFLNKIEPNLPKDKPIIIYEYPLPQASLAKKKNKNSFYAERFEVYIAGLELANAFSELTDAKEQLSRLKEEQRLRTKLKKDIISIDKDFICALKLGIPPSGGIALGIDRLQMLLLNIKDINDLLLFPAKQLFDN